MTPHPHIDILFMPKIAAFNQEDWQEVIIFLLHGKSKPAREWSH